MNKVKTCVYAISLNEIKHVDKFMESCRGADIVLVCDTGSTDGTPERLRELGAVVYSITQRPWRFDAPRNTALNLIPADIDICLSIDLDEYLQPGWVDAINAVWQQTNGTVKRIGYDYIWSWKEDGITPDVRFFADKIHHRQGYRWRHPCHETLYWEEDTHEVRLTTSDLILHHRADPQKSRGQYLHLLKWAVDEDPTNDRMSHYYARELMFHGRHNEAIEEFNRHLALPLATWKEERSASMRYISRCYRNLADGVNSVNWAIRSTLEWDKSREPWLELCRSALYAKDWATCFWASQKCLSITTRDLNYMSDGACWGSEPYDHAAISAYYLELYPQAVEYGQVALDHEPDNCRFVANMEFYKSAV